MSGTVELYNKYRPMKFSEFIGQPFAVGQGKSIANGNHSQAILISGPRGVGKTSLAYVIAMALNCKDIDPENGDPCGICWSCRSIKDGASFDVISVNAAEDNSVAMANSIVSTVREGIPQGIRVYVIDEAHRLTPQAQSSFLEVMERPPKNIVFIMTTTDVSKILDTITSRASSRGKMRPVPDDILTKHLVSIRSKEKDNEADWSKVDDTVIRSIVESSEGSVREALSRLSNFVYRGVSSAVPESISEAIAAAMLAKSPGNVVKLVTKEVAEGTDPMSIAEAVSHELVMAAVSDSTIFILARETLNLRTQMRDAAFPGKVLVTGLASITFSSGESNRLSEIERKLDLLIGNKQVNIFSIDTSVSYKENVKKFAEFVKNYEQNGVPKVFYERLKSREVSFSHIKDGAFEVTFEGSSKEDIIKLSKIVDPRIIVKG